MKKLVYILSIFIISLIIIVISIPAYEAYSGKEYPYFKSNGNCRIKNTELAIEKSASVYYFYNEVNDSAHVITIKNNKYYDASNNNYEEGDFNGTYKGYEPYYFTDVQNIDYDCNFDITCISYNFYTKIFVYTKKYF